MSERIGQIKVNTSDILPIIKKWLYSEHDIFLRELVANATDAVTKRSTMARTLNAEIPVGRIEVTVNETAKTIEVKDNGIGMTEEEVEKYLAQLAFSGAEEFVQKLKENGEDKFDIIGKFGLGFYSAFMVASKVEVETLSMTPGAKAAKWVCEGDTDYTFQDCDKKEIGTTVRLHINDDSKEFLSAFKIKETLKNFCDFMPYEIYVADQARIDNDTDKEKPYTPDLINQTKPLWKQDPKDLKDEDYINFFHKLYPMDQSPLFWIHLKVDHPFTLEGILYFPRVNLRRPTNESNIRLYCKQVFVSNNVKDVIPDFLSLLKGAIDSQDIPLNVSRSALQGDPNIKRITNYVVKKVSEALKKLFAKDREKFEKIWEDIGLFVKYGVISDSKFDEQMRSMVIFKNSDGKYQTLSEYKASVPEAFKEKMKDKVLYFEKEKSDLQLRKHLLEESIQTIEVDDHIDPHFMQHVEYQKQGDEEFHFASLDSEMSSLLQSDETHADDIKIKDLFQKILAPKKEDSEKEEDKHFTPGTEIEIGKLKNPKTVAYIKVDESIKRMQNMMRSMGQDSNFPLKRTLVINPSNPLVQNALKLSEKGGHDVLVDKLCHYVEDLARLSSDGLKAEDKEQFVSRSQDLISELTKFAL